MANRCGPGSEDAVRWARKAIVMVRIDEGCSGGDRFDDEVAVALMNVVAIA